MAKDTSSRRDTRVSSSHGCVFQLEEKSLGKITFPFHSYNKNGSRMHRTSNQYFSDVFTTSMFSKLFHFPKVYASDTPTTNTSKSDVVGSKADSETKKLKDSSENKVSSDNKEQLSRNTEELEAVARAFIEKETGMERVRMIFQKDHKGDSSIEVDYIKLALIQTFVISFFMRYIPTWRAAKYEWIREHQATVFRTRIEAIRRMQDYIFLKAAAEAGSFTAKITMFSAGFLVISQAIASYRNKTSVVEYAAAAGVTGGIMRLHLGLKGFVVGSVLGTSLGTVIGGLAYVLFHAFGVTQETRHLEAVMSKLEVERYIVGESEFKQKVERVKQERALPAPAS